MFTPCTTREAHKTCSGHRLEMKLFFCEQLISLALYKDIKSSQTSMLKCPTSSPPCLFLLHPDVSQNNSIHSSILLMTVSSCLLDSCHLSNFTPVFPPLFLEVFLPFL